MLTVLSSPKPFLGETAWNQLNALRSWRAIHPDVEIIIFGAPAGAAEAAAEVGAVLVPEIEFSASGAPSFNSMVEYACPHGRYEQQVYVNADILLDSSILDAIETSARRFDRFLLVGERMDLAPTVRIEARKPGWVTNLTDLNLAKQLLPHGHTGTDYFGFTRGMWDGLPAVFMGRAMCDQALLHFCFTRRIPVIDATLLVVAVHQFHDYGHIAGGLQEVFMGEDWKTMKADHGLHNSLPTIGDADWCLVERGVIQPNRFRRRLLRRMEIIFRYRFRLGVFSAVLRAMQYMPYGKKGVLPKKLSGTLILNAWTKRHLAGRSQ